MATNRAPLTFQRLSIMNQARCEEVFHPIDAWSPTDWACALAGEVGEACNLLKKLKRLESSRADTVSLIQTQDAQQIVADVALELADAVAYIDLLATRLGIDLEQAVVDKFNAVSLRTFSAITL